ncbi:hypothetical protein AVEN_128303-1, partial [Araneus ventricosus]
LARWGYTNDIRQHLNVTFGKHWIFCGGPIQWPARWPDLSCLDLFCWSQMKTLVYETPVDSVEDVVARISVAAAEMQLLRCETCQESSRTF